MILILIALIAATGLSTYYANSGGRHEISFIRVCAAPMFCVFGWLGLLLYGVLAWNYFAAGYTVSIINREYGTSYTQLEVYYASDAIETIRELNRSRIQIKADINIGK